MRGRKSGYAPVEMTILLSTEFPFPGEVRGTADPSASLGMTKERAMFHEE
jgi:hypothetical protein